MTPQEYHAIINRQRRLPQQIAATWEKLERLIADAHQLGVAAEIEISDFNGDLIAMERSKVKPVAGITAGLI